MRYRAHVQYGFARNEYGIHLSRENLTLQPVQLDWQPMEAFVETPPAFYLDGDAMRALYDALGQALGLHLSDTRLAADVLKLEQSRVDRLIAYITTSL